MQQDWKKRCGMYIMCFLSLLWCGSLLHFEPLNRTLETQIIDEPATTKTFLEAVQLPTDTNAVNSEQKRATACTRPSTVTNPVTGFNLTCPCNSPADLPAGIREVKLFYHVGMTNNWKEIMEDQLTTLDNCGLGHYASSLTITYTNGEPEQLMDVLKNYKNFDVHTGRVNMTLLPGPKTAPWERRSINAIYDTCYDAAATVKDNFHANSTNDTKNNDSGDVVVFYFHNKGAGKYSPQWKTELHKERSYSRSLYWRKYLEYFTLERPGLCLNALADGASTCGVELKVEPYPHYSGNFWSAACNYIVQSQERMSSSSNKNNGYLSAEFWIGSGMVMKNLDRRRHVSLFNRNWDLYKHLVLPKEYSIQNEAKALQIVSSISIMSLYKQYYDSVLKSVLDPVTSGG